MGKIIKNDISTEKVLIEKSIEKTIENHVNLKDNVLNNEPCSDINVIELYNKSHELATRYNFLISIKNNQFILSKMNKQIGSFNTISNLFFFLKGYQLKLLENPYIQ